MACWICTFGSAYSSTLELNSAIRYFHALTNGLAIQITSAFVSLCVLSANLSVPRRSLHPTRGFCQVGSGHCHRNDLRDDDLRCGVDIVGADAGDSLDFL